MKTEKGKLNLIIVLKRNNPVEIYWVKFRK
jgi:hypothetical protein